MGSDLWIVLFVLALNAVLLVLASRRAAAVEPSVVEPSVVEQSK